MKNKFFFPLIFIFWSLVPGPESLVHSQSPSPIFRIQIEDFIIHPITAEYIEKAIDKAKAEKAEALLIVLDTPGGLLESTRTIVKKMMGAEVPVIVYVAPAGSRAASAGVFITLAGHVAAMAPSTHIGAAHPVEMGEEGQRTMDHGPWTKKQEKEGSKPRTKNQEPSTSPMSEKIMQDTLAWVENIAKARHRNVAWAKKSVTESASITAEEALKLGVIDTIAKDEKELLAKLDGRKVALANKTVVLHTKTAVIEKIPLTWRQSLLNILINPNIAYILLTLGFYGLLFEITHPGAWAPGVAGLICVLLAFYSFHLIPTSYAGVILTVIGLILLGAELFIVSHGAMALGGLVSLFFGALFLVDQPAELFKLSLRVALPTIGASAVVFALLATLVIRSRKTKVVTGEEGLIGEIGEADTPISSGGGKIFVKGEIWDAVSEEPIGKGEKVQILALENFKVRVKKV